ncbi:hypothetical protein HK100_008276 [Physocladia obscura]|uniref:Uncharacterized protein n=1 Tax=Physocladia obscura TaxID=109957 RepID=A0AAD5TAZ3_9FUNG|nr:hypothetical protein HK100_008276 [Physocladia obscura]
MEDTLHTNDLQSKSFGSNGNNSVMSAPSTQLSTIMNTSIDSCYSHIQNLRSELSYIGATILDNGRDMVKLRSDLEANVFLTGSLSSRVNGLRHLAGQYREIIEKTMPLLAFETQTLVQDDLNMLAQFAADVEAELPENLRHHQVHADAVFHRITTDPHMKISSDIHGPHMQQNSPSKRSSFEQYSTEGPSKRSHQFISPAEIESIVQKNPRLTTSKNDGISSNIFNRVPHPFTSIKKKSIDPETDSRIYSFETMETEKSVAENKKQILDINSSELGKNIGEGKEKLVYVDFSPSVFQSVASLEPEILLSLNALNYEHGENFIEQKIFIDNADMPSPEKPCKEILRFKCEGIVSSLEFEDTMDGDEIFDEPRILYSGTRGIVEIWDLKQSIEARIGKRAFSIDCQTDGYVRVTKKVLTNENIMLIAGEFGEVIFCDLKAPTPSIISKLPIPFEHEYDTYTSGAALALNSSFTAMTVHNGGGVNLWDVRSKSMIRTIGAHIKEATCCGFYKGVYNDNCDSFITSGVDGVLKLWDSRGGRDGQGKSGYETGSFTVPQKVYSMGCDPIRSGVCALGYDNNDMEALDLVDLQDVRIVTRIHNFHTEQIMSIKYSKNGTCLMSDKNFSN